MSTELQADMDPSPVDELAEFAHALRTPLSAIGGLAQLLEIGIHGPVTPAQSTALGRIRANQELAVTLIAEFMHHAELKRSTQGPAPSGEPSENTPINVPLDDDAR